MLLKDKIAIVYGAGGAIGGAIARAFAREGATVFLAGHTKTKLDEVAKDIRASGGPTEMTVVDALDEKAVDAYVGGVAKQAGHIDISVNVIGLSDVQQPL